MKKAAKRKPSEPLLSITLTRSQWAEIYEGLFAVTDPRAKLWRDKLQAESNGLGDEAVTMQHTFNAWVTINNWLLDLPGLAMLGHAVTCQLGSEA